jgi:hypothetical protein
MLRQIELCSPVLLGVAFGAALATSGCATASDDERGAVANAEQALAITQSQAWVRPANGPVV